MRALSVRKKVVAICAIFLVNILWVFGDVALPNPCNPNGTTHAHYGSPTTNGGPVVTISGGNVIGTICIGGTPPTPGVPTVTKKQPMHRLVTVENSCHIQVSTSYEPLTDQIITPAPTATWTLSPSTFNTPGPQSVTVTYTAAGAQDHAVTGTVTVVEVVSVTLSPSQSAYCRDGGVTVTAALTGGASLPTGCTVTWGGDATFSNPTGLTATAQLGTVGTGKKITASVGSQSPAKDSATFDVVEVVEVTLDPNQTAYCTGDEITVTAALTGGASLPTGCTVTWEGDATFSNQTGLTATAQLETVGTGKKISASVGSQSPAIDSLTFDVVEVVSVTLDPNQTAYCKGEEIKVTAALTGGASLPTGCTVTWEGDATFSNQTGLTATAQLGTAGTGKKIKASVGSQTPAIDSTTFNVSKITAITPGKATLVFNETTQFTATTEPSGLTCEYIGTFEADTAHVASPGDVEAWVEDGFVTSGTVKGILTVRAKYGDCESEPVSITIECQSCTTCQPGADGELESLKFYIRDGVGGKLTLHEQLPSDNLTKISQLSYPYVAQNIEKVLGSDNILRQVKTTAGLLDLLQIDAYSYHVKFYERSAIGPKDEDGLYTVAGMPSRWVEVLNPDGAASNNRFRFTQTEQGGHPTVNEFRYDATENTWSMSKALNLQTGKAMVWKALKKETYGTNTIRETRTTYDNEGVLYSKTIEDLTTFDFGQRKVQSIVVSDNSQEITIIEYYLDPQELGYGKIKSMVYPDGSWVKYEYDSKGRFVKEVRPFVNSEMSAPDSEHKVRVFGYEPVDWSQDYGNDRPDAMRHLTVSLQGQMVEEQFWIISPNTTQHIRSAVPGSAWNQPGHLITVERTGASGFNRAKLVFSKASDGTVTLIQRDALGNGGNLITTYRGEPNADESAIVRGTKTVERLDSDELWVERSVFDIESGLCIERETVAERDAQKRVIHQTYLDGTSETRIYGCCGLEQETNRQGIVTQYTNDELKRVEFTIRGGLKTFTEWSPAGQVLSTTLVSANNQTLEVSAQTYGLGGEMTSSTRQGVRTEYERRTLADGTVENVTRNADGGEVVKRMGRDRQILEVSGSAAIPTTMSYGLAWDMNRGFFARWSSASVSENGLELSRQQRWTDPLGRVYKVVHLDGSADVTTYNALGQVSSVQDSSGRVTLYKYGSDGSVELVGWDANKNGIMDLNGEDAVTKTVFAFGLSDNNLVKTTQTFAWEEVGNITPVLVQTSQEFLLTNTVKSIDRLGLVSVQTMEITGGGNTKNIQIQPTGITRIDEYNQGKLASSRVLSPSGNLVQWVERSYDLFSRLSSQVDSMQDHVQYTYNSVGQLTSETHNDGAQTSYVYDSMGRKLTETKRVTLSESTQNSFAYNLRGQMVESMESSDNLRLKTTRQFDVLGRLTTITDTKGNATSYQYDSKGRITKETYADGGEIVQTYDSEGKLIRRVDQKQQVILYNYDPQGRLIEKKYGPTGVQTYGYDSFGRLSSTLDNNDGRMEVKTELTYNAQHQNIAETLQIANDPAQTIHKTYDNVGRLMALRYPSGREVRTTYTELGQTNQIFSKVAGSANAVVVDYDYGNELGETNSVLRRKKLNNGIQAELDVDSRGRSTRIDWKQGGSTLVGFEYRYNLLGDRVQDRQLHNSNFDETYRYDSARRLVGYGRTDGKRQNWNLDGLGNWEGFSSSGNAAGSVEETRTHNAMNEILTIAGGAIPQVLDHDDNGNMVAYNNKAYSWDANNRLMGVTKNTASGTEYVAKYYYSAMNRRVLKHTDSNGDGLLDSEMVFVNDGEQTLAEQKRNGSLLREHIFGGQFVDEVVLTVDSVRGSENFSLVDLRYSVFAVANAGGVVVERYQYDPYGKRTVMNTGYGVLAESVIGQEFGYTGRQHDSEDTGLMYFRARYYSVDLGRFVGRDPLGTTLDVNYRNKYNEMEAGSCYHDGMSLYQSYFSVKGTDAYGMKCKLLLSKKAWWVGTQQRIGIDIDVTCDEDELDSYGKVTKKFKIPYGLSDNEFYFADKSKTENNGKKL